MRLPLTSIEIFNAICKAGSLRGAADILSLEPSSVSHQLKSLEQQLGVSLFVRTTRSINLTEAGRVLAKTTNPIFKELTEAIEDTKKTGKEASGKLKLAVPEFAYYMLLEKKLAGFQKQYPDIELELSLSDGVFDILDEGFHAGFRLGGFVANDMVAVALTKPLKTCIVASPEYLEQNGVPQIPKDLLNHNCLRYRFISSNQVAPWLFMGEGEEFQVQVKGNLIANSSPVALDLAKQGAGIAFTFKDYCTQAIEGSTLVELLPSYRCTRPAINIYFPPEYRNMQSLRLLMAAIKQ